MNYEEKSEKVIDGKSYSNPKIGADPELRFEGIKARPTVAFEGKFGTDGPNSQVGELRPEPKYCPINETMEIERVMRDGFKKYPLIQNRRWLAGSMPEGNPIGGHIHIGSDANIDLELKLTAFDKLLASVCSMLENKETAMKRRQGTEYGKLAMYGLKVDPKHRGFKTKSLYSGNSHPLSHNGYEYRPLGSWLVSRQITAGVLSLAKVIAFQTHNQSLHRHIGRQLSYIKLDKKFVEAHTNCDKRYFAGLIPTVYRIVSSFKLFPYYDKHINYLFHLISQNRTWEEDIDIKERWSIVPTITQSKKIIVPKIWTFNEIWNNGLTSSASDLGIIESTENESQFLVGGV